MLKEALRYPIAVAQQRTPLGFPAGNRTVHLNLVANHFRHITDTLKKKTSMHQVSEAEMTQDQKILKNNKKNCRELEKKASCKEKM